MLAACKDTSTDQLLLLSKATPIELVVKHAGLIYQMKKTADVGELDRVKAELDAFWCGRSERKLIGRVDTCESVNRFCLISYSSVRFLTGHGGMFNDYLYRIEVSDTPLCIYCAFRDTHEHVLFDCPAFADLRGRYLKDNVIMNCSHGEKAVLNRKDAEDFVSFCDHARKRKEIPSPLICLN